MNVKVLKNDKESNERLISRFNKIVQASRKLNDVRSERYYSRDLTKSKIRNAAIKREHYRALREKKTFY